MADIDELPNVLKLARENAILGNYDESIKEYNQGVVIIQNYLISQTTKTSREQWKFVESSILLELTHVKDILSINEGFTNNFGYKLKLYFATEYQKIKTNADSKPVKVSGSDNNFAMKHPIQRKTSHFEHLSEAEPFTYQKDDPSQYYGRNIDDFEVDKNFFVI